MDQYPTGKNPSHPMIFEFEFEFESIIHLPLLFVKIAREIKENNKG